MLIRSLLAWEILDSRGNPTIAARCELSDGTAAKAHVPSGASTGRHEALELRDGDPARYGGKGVLGAVRNVNERIAPALLGKSVADQQRIDNLLIELDGTKDKSNLGANATLAVSCAVARACAAAKNIPLWKSLQDTRKAQMPVPMVNIISGGLHAGHNIEFQDFLVMPTGITGYARQMEAVAAIHRATRLVLESNGYALTGVADEGGWGPKLASNREALTMLCNAVERAGFEAGKEVFIALDVAASHFYSDDHYHLHTQGEVLTRAGMVTLLEEWCGRYPIRSIEDGLDQDDWTGWQALTARLGGRVQLIGDDLFTTDIERLNRGIELRAGNAILVKMNQIGTLSETFRVIDRARQAGFRTVISARSGETEDDFLADLAVASGAGQIKIGSVTRSERLAKYNRLFEIEREMS